ncbi:hypothetical protein V8F06_004262 [Rhypophila decipiens]
MPTNVVIIPSTAARQSPPRPVEPEYQVERDLKAKFVPSPQKLLEELRRAVGPDQYYSVEMRHNVYKIRASTDFDLQRLISSF